MDIRAIVQNRLDELDWSAYRLINELRGKKISCHFRDKSVRKGNEYRKVRKAVPAVNIYEFLANKAALNSDYLGWVLDVIGLKADALQGDWQSLKPVLKTDRGELFQCDCLDMLRSSKAESVDTIFADPPFNVGKSYGVSVNSRRITDSMPEGVYLHWCQQWLKECVRVLKPGGALFVYNLNRWNMPLGTFLSNLPELKFRHWITVNINGQLPIRNKLLTQGYSLLYFTKGRPKTFHPILTPLEKCRHCGQHIKDYGGKIIHFSRQGGTTLSDVWNDVTAVRHEKFRTQRRGAKNQLSTKILERAILMTTKPNDLVCDPFGGSGTTYAVAEMLGRRWIGSEIGPVDAIRERLNGKVAHHPNDDIVPLVARRPANARNRRRTRAKIA